MPSQPTSPNPRRLDRYGGGGGFLSLPLVGRVARRERSERRDGWGATTEAVPGATPTPASRFRRCGVYHRAGQRPDPLASPSARPTHARAKLVADPTRGRDSIPSLLKSQNTTRSALQFSHMRLPCGGRANFVPCEITQPETLPFILLRDVAPLSQLASCPSSARLPSTLLQTGGACLRLPTNLAPMSADAGEGGHATSDAKPGAHTVVSDARSAAAAERGGGLCLAPGRGAGVGRRPRGGGDRRLLRAARASARGGFRRGRETILRDLQAASSLANWRRST